MVAMTSHPGGTVLAVRAQPGAKRNAIVGERAGALRVSVTAAPEKGRANEAIIGVLADSLGLRRSAVRLLGGETSRDKRLLIEGLTPEELSSRLAPRLLDAAGRTGERDHSPSAVDDDRNER